MTRRVRLAVSMLSGLCLAQEQAPGPGFLRPLDQSVLRPGPVAVVARSQGEAKLLLDGQPVPFSAPAINAVSATLQAPAGRHELTLVTGGAEHKIQFFVAGTPGEAPAGWKVFRPHPPAAGCDTCHAVKEGRWAFKAAMVSESCLGCHTDTDKFAKVHSHAPKVLEECQLCHQAHGSTVQFHLKYAKDTACKLCHG